MFDNQEMAFGTIQGISRLIKEKQISPVEITHLYLKRIARLDPKINSYLTVAIDSALQQAAAAEQAIVDGMDAGPLNGIPISVKDLTKTEGIRTTLGSAIFKDLVPDADELVVERVKRAGAVILGKTNTPEFGLSATTDNRLGDHCRNPWDVKRTSGGSSGGAAAATAAGLNVASLGSDGGGSLRVPAAFCGMFTIKPTDGRVPRRGTSKSQSKILASFSQDGPITRTVTDAAMLLQVIAGPHPESEFCLNTSPPDFSAGLHEGVSGLRIVWTEDFGCGDVAIHSEVRKAARSAVDWFSDAGAEIYDSSFDIDLLQLDRSRRVLTSASFYAQYGHLLDDWQSQMMPYTLEYMEAGNGVTDLEKRDAMDVIENFRTRFQDVFSDVDLVMSPVTSVPAFEVEMQPSEIEGRDVSGFGRRSFYPMTYPINIAGNPAASMPCGRSSGDLPIALQVIGPLLGEGKVLRVCRAYEQANPWPLSPPDFSSI
jgi:Asp-tRNA(Asn)/Glu-tRNA(Gln) amidotransferase A subunit family amidase